MMSSAKQTEETRGVTVSARAVAWVVLAIGAIPIVDINGWRFGAPVFFLLLAWVAIVWAGYAVWRSGSAAAASGRGTGDVGFDAGTHRDQLEQEKRILLKAIKEIEFDRAMGKMSDEDAARLTAHYRGEAIAVLKALSDDGGASLDERIDAELRAHKQVEKATKGKKKGKSKKPAKSAGAAKAEADE